MMQGPEDFYMPSLFKLEQRLSELIRIGYLKRISINSNCGFEFADRSNPVDTDLACSSEPHDSIRGFTIMGMSGIGKWRII